jgi:hypothetical protein
LQSNTTLIPRQKAMKTKKKKKTPKEARTLSTPSLTNSSNRACDRNLADVTDSVNPQKFPPLVGDHLAVVARAFGKLRRVAL